MTAVSAHQTEMFLLERSHINKHMATVSSIMPCLAYLLGMGEVCRMPAAIGMPVRIDMHMLGMMVGGPMLYLLVSLSDRHVDRRSRRLRPSDWGSVRGVLLREGLEL